MQFTAISWNLFHGRDFPPDPELRTWRSRLLRRSETNATHVQVNRDLDGGVRELLGATAWDVALLQEAPPRFAAAAGPGQRRRGPPGVHLPQLARLAAREGWRGINPGPDRLRRGRLQPDPGAGASGPLGGIAERRELDDPQGPPRAPCDGLHREPRRASASPTCTRPTGTPNLRSQTCCAAARAASEWAGSGPCSSAAISTSARREDPEVFDDLRERFGLTAPTGPRAIDHLLVRGLDDVAAPTPWPARRRELPRRLGRCDSLITLRSQARFSDSRCTRN